MPVIYPSERVPVYFAPIIGTSTLMESPVITPCAGMSLAPCSGESREKESEPSVSATRITSGNDCWPIVMLPCHGPRNVDADWAADRRGARPRKIRNRMRDIGCCFIISFFVCANVHNNLEAQKCGVRKSCVIRANSLILLLEMDNCSG